MPTKLTVRRVYNVTVTIPETVPESSALVLAKPAIDAAVIAATHAPNSEDIVLEEIDELVSA